MILRRLFLLIAFSILIVPFGLSQEEIAPTPDYLAIEEELGVLKEASESLEGESMVKIVLIILGVVVLGVVVFFIYRKAKEDGNASENDKDAEASEENPTQRV